MKQGKNKDNWDVPNYSMSAIKSFRTTFNVVPDYAYPETKRGVDIICRMLDESVKFILPNKGVILNDSRHIKDLKQEWIDLTILPFPICAFEFSYEDDKEEIGENLAQSTKRIALAWNIHSDHHLIKELNEHIGTENIEWLKKTNTICLLAVSYIDENKQWSFSSCAVSLRTDLSLEDYQGVASLKADMLNIFPEYALEVKVGIMREKNIDAESAVQVFMNSVLGDNSTELVAVIHACCTLNCQNVKTKDILPPPALVKSREKRKLPPLYSYKTLEITTHASSGRGASEIFYTGGGHRRGHFRRGHIRRLQSGAQIWVRDAMVSASNAKGNVDKQYRIK